MCVRDSVPTRLLLRPLRHVLRAARRVGNHVVRGLGSHGECLDEAWGGRLLPPNPLEIDAAPKLLRCVGDLGDRVGDHIGAIASCVPRLSADQLLH